jgi:hypothetical protein
MPKQCNFEIVPISEVPPPESGIKVNGLEALLVDDGRSSAATSLGARNWGAECFEVSGLPPEQKARIRQQDGKCHLMVEESTGESKWLGEYSCVQDALQALWSRLI